MRETKKKETFKHETTIYNILIFYFFLVSFSVLFLLFFIKKL